MINADKLCLTFYEENVSDNNFPITVNVRNLLSYVCKKQIV